MSSAPYNHSLFSFFSCQRIGTSVLQTSGIAAPALARSGSLHTCCRWFATARGTTDGARVDPSKIKALLFHVTLKDAEQHFYQHQHSNPLLAAPSSYDKVKETYLPFWLVQMVVNVRASQAQVGHRVAVHRRDPRTGRTQLTWETEWSVARAAYARQATHLPEQVHMQVCASSKYLSWDTRKMCPGELVHVAEGLGHLKPITSPGVLNDDRRVVPFTLRPADARQQVLQRIMSLEREVAENWYRRAFNAEEVRSVDLDIDVVQQATFPLYVPVYVFSRTVPPSSLEIILSGIRQPGTMPTALKVHTLVSGCAPGVVAGSKLYDPVKVGTAVGLLAPLLLAMTGLAPLLRLPQVLLIGSIGPAMLAAAAARHAPHLRHAAASASGYVRKQLPSWTQIIAGAVLGPRLSRMLGILGDGRGDAEPGSEYPSSGHDHKRSTAHDRMEDEWVHMYSRESTYSGTYSSGSKSGSYDGYKNGYTGGSSGGSSSRGGGSSWSSTRGPGYSHPADDPQGYYKILGVKQNASPAEVQEAFRTKALQQHPDRYTDAEAKAKATASFQKLSEAYNVLRNPKKRAAYDMVGRV